MSPGAGVATERYEPVIGLEIHVQLLTATKMFCGCRVEFGAEPNSRVCPVCLGLPGALPVINGHAVELAVLAARTLHCTVSEDSVFARKNYFYPDLPKGYQITQYARPLATEGWLDVEDGDGGGSRVRVRRLHVEEDSGKSLHDRYPERTAVDLNRAGVPLIEVVTEPDLRSPAQARAFLLRLKQALEYIGVSDCNMEEGSLRVDANLSIRPLGGDELATKTELKNMNSFSQLEKALAFEFRRQMGLVAEGGVVEPQTLLWDPLRGEARPMRGKEEVHDYRYFPEPDLPNLRLPAESLAEADARLTEMPWDRRERFVRDHGLPEYDAGVLCATRELADYFEEVTKASADAKTAANWIMGEMMAIGNERGVSVPRLGLAPGRLAELLGLVEAGTLSGTLGKQVLRRMVETGRPAREIMKGEGLEKVTDSDRLGAWIREALEQNPEEVERYRAGEKKLLAYFIGQVMQRSRGKADPARLRAELQEALES